MVLFRWQVLVRLVAPEVLLTAGCAPGGLIYIYMVEECKFHAAIVPW